MTETTHHHHDHNADGIDASARDPKTGEKRGVGSWIGLGLGIWTLVIILGIVFTIAIVVTAL